MTTKDDSFYEAMEQDGVESGTSGAAGATAPTMTEEEQEAQREEWRKELTKLEQEIHTLQSVLHTKVRAASELKRKLGIGAMTEIKDDIKTSFKTITDSDAYQKTSDAFKSFGAWSSRKIGDARNSNMFKSVEEKVGGAYTNVKTRVTGSQSENNFPNSTSPTGDGTGVTSADDSAHSAPTSAVNTPTTASDVSTPKQQVPM